MSNLDELLTDPALIETDEHGTALALAGVNPEAHDWPDDRRYLCRCAECNTQFFGPKRSPMCWRCWSARKQAPPADAPAMPAGVTAIGLLADNRYLADVNSQLALRVTTLEREIAALREALELAKHMLGPHFIRSCGTCEKCGGTTPNGTLRVCRTCGMSAIDAALADGKGEKPCGGA